MYRNEKLKWLKCEHRGRHVQGLPLTTTSSLANSCMKTVLSNCFSMVVLLSRPSKASLYCSSSTTTAEGVDRHLRTSLEYHKCFYTMHLNCVSIVKTDKRTITLTVKIWHCLPWLLWNNVMIVDTDIFFPHFLYIAFGSNFCMVSKIPPWYMCMDSVHKTQVYMQLIPPPWGKLNLCKKVTKIETKQLN